MTDSRDFLIEEYKSLRAEILATQQARRDYEIYGAGAIAALYGWLSTKDHSSAAMLSMIAWWVPPILAAAVAWRTLGLSKGIRTAGGYLKKIETSMLGETTPEGWHRHLGATRELRKSGLDAEKNFALYFWLLVAIVTLGIAFHANTSQGIIG